MSPTDRKAKIPEEIWGAVVFGLFGLAIACYDGITGNLMQLGTALGLCALAGSFISALAAIRKRPILASIIALLIGAVGYGVFMLYPQKISTNLRIAAIKEEVERERSRVGDAKVIASIVANPKIAGPYKRTVSESNPAAVSFLVLLYGIDNGYNLIFDPSRRFATAIEPDGRIDPTSEKWQPYKPLVECQPVNCKDLGNGWYLVSFT